MWFGIAPAPAPSPRTNTKAWHPLHCSCARHGGGAEDAPSPTPRSRARRSDVANDSPHLQDKSVKQRERWLPRVRSPQKALRDTSNRSAHVSEAVPSTNRPRENEERAFKLEGPGNSGAEIPAAKGPGTTVRSSFNCNIGHGVGNSQVTAGASTFSSVHLQSSAGTELGSTRLQLGRQAIDDTECRLSSPSIVDRSSASSAQTMCHRGSRGQPRQRESGLHVVPRLLSSSGPPGIVIPGDAMRLIPPMLERAQPTNLVGHTSSVGVVLVDDDNFIVSCSIDGSVKVWSRLTFDCLYTLYGHSDAVSSVDLSSQWLVSGSHDHTLRVYESGHGFRFIHSLEGHTGHVTRVKLVTHQRDLVVSCSDDATLRLWDVEHGSCLVVYKMHLSRITCVLVIPSPVGVICSGSADSSVCLWDLLPPPTSTGHKPGEPRICLSASKFFQTHKSTVQCLLAGDSVPLHSGYHVNSIVFSCSSDGTIQWFDVWSRQHLGYIDKVHSPVYSMTFHSHLRSLVCSTGDGRLLVYTGLVTGSRHDITKQELKITSKWISSLQPLTGQFLACASEDDLYVVNLDRLRIERFIATAHGFLNCIGWLKHERLITSGEDNVIKVWPIL